MPSIVYMLTCATTGKSYIGVTQRTLQVRWRAHRNDANNPRCKMIIAKAIAKHGDEAWKREILHTFDTAENAYKMEVIEIAARKTQTPAGYNILGGGRGGQLGREVSEETRRKIGAKHAGKKVSEQTRKKLQMAHLGRKHAPERIAKTIQGLTGRVCKEETRRKHSARMLGTMQSEESKKKTGTANSRFYMVTLPSGEEVKIHGFSKFCRDNDLVRSTAVDAMKYGRTYKGFSFSSIPG